MSADKILPQDVIDFSEADWKSTDMQSDGSGLPYATHEGAITFMGTRMRCYQLSDGRCVINADDLRDFINTIGLS